MADDKEYEGGELEGQSFRNEALTGSGTILPDGTYGEPLPDPTEVRGIGPRRTSGGRIVPEPNMFAEEVPSSEKMRLDAETKKTEAPKTESPKTESPKKATGTTK